MGVSKYTRLKIVFWMDVKKQQIHDWSVENIQLKTKSNNSALLSDDGFFLAEMLMGVFIISIITLMITNLLVVAMQASELNRDYLNLAKLANGMNGELIIGNSVVATADQIDISTYNHVITYQLTDNKLIRKVDSNGYERVAVLPDNGEFVVNGNSIYYQCEAFKPNFKILIWRGNVE